MAAGGGGGLLLLLLLFVGVVLLRRRRSVLRGAGGPAGSDSAHPAPLSSSEVVDEVGAGRRELPTHDPYAMPDPAAPAALVDDTPTGVDAMGAKGDSARRPGGASAAVTPQQRAKVAGRRKVSKAGKGKGKSKGLQPTGTPVDSPCGPPLTTPLSHGSGTASPATPRVRTTTTITVVLPPEFAAASGGADASPSRRAIAASGGDRGVPHRVKQRVSARPASGTTSQPHQQRLRVQPVAAQTAVAPGVFDEDPYDGLLFRAPVSARALQSPQQSESLAPAAVPPVQQPRQVSQALQ